MVRETRHLWVGNLPDNIREDRIREHFKRYGRVQSVKLLPRCTEEKTGEITMACTVAFMDIKSASKAHNAELKIDDRTLNTEYYEPAAIPSSASPQNTSSPYSNFPNGHGSTDEHGTFPERFYDRSTARVASEGEFIRRTGYHDANRSRNRDRSYRNGPYNSLMDRHSRTLNSSWTYDSTRYNSNTGCNQTETGYSTTPSDTNERRSSDRNSKKKTKSRSGSRSPSPSGSTSSRSPSRSRSRSSSSSSSSPTSPDSSSTSSRKSRRPTSSTKINHQPVVHSDDRRPLAICVKNLPVRSSDTSLKDGLFHEYKKVGKVTWVKVVGQNSERHAIVCFKKPEDVEKAMETSVEKLFFGCTIQVTPYQAYDVEDNDLRPYEAEIDEFHPKATRTLFIGNLEKDVTASDLRKHFDQFGEIIEIDIKKQAAVSSYAFCQYSDIVSVVKAIRKMDGEHLGNNRIKLGFGKSMPYNCVWIDGVNENVNEKYLRMQFEPFGVITKVHIDREKGQALVFYEQVLHAQAAVNKMRGFNLKNTKIQLDFASRECQESFFERLEKQGTGLDRGSFEERRDSVTRSFDSTTAPRFSRYDTPTRPRTSSYSGSRSSITANQVTSALQSPSTPGSVTPRGTGSRQRSTRYEYYEGMVDYPDRHFRSYDEYSQGSPASHGDPYEPEYAFPHDSPSQVADPLDARSVQNEPVVAFGPPDIKNLQKERVHLLEQLEECPSSGDELSPKKRLKLNLIDPPIATDVIIEANRDHRKVVEVRRLSDANIRHHSRRPSVDLGKHSLRGVGHDRYLPHTICKRRRTGGSERRGDFSDSENSSRPGTPLCDEKPEKGDGSPKEPRTRKTEEKVLPIKLRLPWFASQIINLGNLNQSSLAEFTELNENFMWNYRAAPASPRIFYSRPPSPVPEGPPASPTPRSGSNSSDGDGIQSLDERIRSLDEKYEKWSGTRSLSASGGETLAMIDANIDKLRTRSKILQMKVGDLEPSDIVKCVLSKPSIFDNDQKRLMVGDKLESKEFFEETTTAQTTVPAPPLSAPPILKVAPVTQQPKTPTMLSPRSTGTSIPAAKGLQYPFPTHPPIPSHLQNPPTPTSTPLPAPTATSTTTTRSASHGDNRLKPCASVSSDIRTTSKVNVNRSTLVSSLGPIKTSEKTINNIPSLGDGSAVPSSSSSLDKHKFIREVKSSEKTSEKVSYRRDSNSSSPRADVKTRRNSDTSARRIDDSDKFIEMDSSHKERLKNDEEKKEKATLENERLGRERFERERIEKEMEKEAQERERIEKERLEKERLERENELEKQRLEKEKLDKERLEGEERARLEKERADREKERIERVRQERELAEKERLERERIEKERHEQEKLEKERKSREKKEREDRERREKEERDRREREERERIENLERENKERERRDREEKERRGREEVERKEKEEWERREREEQERKEHKEKEMYEEEEKLSKEKLEKERSEKEKHERERKREERSWHKEDNHDRRKDDHRIRENHSEFKHKENSLEKHIYDNKNTKESSKDEKSSRDNHDLFKRDSHESRGSHEKSRHHIERDFDRRKESIKENRDNNIHDKHKIYNDLKDSNIRNAIESRHMSIDTEKNRIYDGVKQDPNRRKERNNSLPANLGSKRRLSSHNSLDSTDECKRIKLVHDHKKLNERRDSKDSTRSEDRTKSSKHKNNIKSHDRHSTKDMDEKRKEREERHKKHKLEKQKSKSKSREKESRESPSTPKSPLTDKDFLARLDLRSNEEMEKLTENKEKRKEHITFNIREEKEKSHDDSMKDKICEKPHNTEKHSKIRSDNDTILKNTEDRKKRDRIRKITNSSDSDSDEPKKHSIFDIVDDEPAYISMYDKVKARSCKNMAKQEEEKRQEKIKAKFSQLKQCRAKREEKKRSTSWDEDSESEDRDPHEVRVKRCPKMLIDSSDDESHDRKEKKEIYSERKKEIYSDSDSSAIMKQIIKREQLDTSEDEIKNKSILKGSKSRITSDTSEDEYKKRKMQAHIKTEFFSDTENANIQGFMETNEKPQLTKVKDELDRLIKKERRNSKHQDLTTLEMSSQIFGDPSPFNEKIEKYSSIHSFIENTTDDEITEINKKERSERREKKHKKKQKKQKHSVFNEDSCKVENDSISGEPCVERCKHEKKKEHSKKEKRRDKTKEGREKSKKSKRNKSESKSESKREGKMENIFGSLSEDSEHGSKEMEQHKSSLFHERVTEEQNMHVYNSGSDRNHENKSKEREEREREREEHKRRKEKKRREKERRLQEAAAAAAIEQTSNDNSMDYADMGKQLEANMMKDESFDAPEEKSKSEVEASSFDNADDQFHFNDVSDMHEIKREKEDRKEGKEKKKKRKKSKDEKSKHHHHHHHDKNKTKSPEFKKEATPPKEIKVEVEESQPQRQSLPTLDENTSSNKIDTPEFTISPSSREIHPVISPIPKTPTTSKEKKRDTFIPGFGVEIDEKIHDSAVKSISEFEDVKKEEVREQEDSVDKDNEISEEKPRVVISQEETEDAVAALLGESFENGKFEECYSDEIHTNNDTTAALEGNAQDDEEMRQAVESLSVTDLDVKPETPQSEHELQIDTDTEEQEEITSRFQPKTPELTEFSQPPKTSDIPTYIQKEEKPESTQFVMKCTANFSSPPSLTPIKPKVPLVTEQKSLPMLPEQQQRSVISQGWAMEKQLEVSAKSESTVIKNEAKKLPSVSEVVSEPTKKNNSATQTQRQYTNPPPVKPMQPEHLKLMPSPEQTAKIQHVQTSTKSAVSPQLHNLQVRSPIQINKPSTSVHDPMVLSPKSTSSLVHNRLPITPVMVSKPLQATTVILQQSKIAHPMEPPKLISSSEPRTPERPRMVFQTSAIQPTPFSNFPSNQPKMLIQGNIRQLPPQGLLVPTRPLPPNTYGYLGNLPPYMSPIVKDTTALIEKNQSNPTLKINQPLQPSLVSTHVSLPQPSIVVSTTSVQDSMSLQQSLTIPKEQAIKSSSALQSPKIIASSPSPMSYVPSSPSPKSSPVPPISPKPVVPTSSPSPSLIPFSFSSTDSNNHSLETSKTADVDNSIDKYQITTHPNIIRKVSCGIPATSTPVIEPPVNKPSNPNEGSIVTEPKSEVPIKLAIEKVTEELNISLKSELSDVKDKTFETEETFEVKNETVAVSKAATTEVKGEFTKELVAHKLETELESTSVIKETEKFDEEKADTESIVSDISKERSSADILSKEDPLDTKEDSDYWSPKEVNIDSVIKTLGSADELSDHISENGKDDWFDHNKIHKISNDNDTNETKSENKFPEAIENKSDESEIHDEGVEPEEEDRDIKSLRSGSRGRNTRGRGRGKARGAHLDRSSIQTRRGKITKEQPMLILSPTKRGRGGRPRNERKASKSEMGTAPTDVYEFRDEPDDNKEQRPRLILTIKSPAVSNASSSVQTTAIVKEVTKDGAKEIGKEHDKDVIVHPIVETKEEFASPVASNTRKSRRLQEKDNSRNTVDDTIEDVVKNTIQTRAAANQRRSTRQATPKQVLPVQPETPRKSPRGRKPRRPSEVTENSSSEETFKEESKSTPTPLKAPEKVKEDNKQTQKPPELPKEKPYGGLKAAMLRRIKVDMANRQHEPTNLIDPVTGELIPMRECEEGKYIPLPGSVSAEPTVISNAKVPQVQLKTPDIKSQPSVIAQPQQATVVQSRKPQSLKAHVLSSQAALNQQPGPIQSKTPSILSNIPSQPVLMNAQINIAKSSPLISKSIPPVLVSKVATPMVVTKAVTPIVVSKPSSPVIISKPVTPISQHLNINTSLPMGVVSATHSSPRNNVPSKIAPKQLINPPAPSPVLSLSAQQKQQMLQVSKAQITKGHMVTAPMTTSQVQMVNTQMAHMKHQPTIKQQVIMGKGLIKKNAHALHQQQLLSGAIPSPPLGKPQSPVNNPSRIIQVSPHGTKGVMEVPKVDVSMGNVILGQRPKLSPQGPQQRLLQSTIPIPGYEASLHGDRSLINHSRSPPPAHQNSPSPKGEAIAHYPPGTLRPPPDINPAHYMHSPHVMQYQQYLRQQQLQHLSRSGGIEKLGDGQEGEEAPNSSPPLELRRPGSVGMAYTGRGASVPHSLHSPHDRATDSPQVGQVYNVPSARMPHYHPNRYYEQTEPPPAHRPVTSHSTLAALGSDRGMAHMAPLGTPDRPLSSHSALSAHMGGMNTSDRSISTQIERPLSAHGKVGAGLGAAGNLMGALARHVGADAPTSLQRIQAATPPHASPVPVQAESLFMLLKHYPCMWQGLLALKNDQAAVQMYFVSGNDEVAKVILPKNLDGTTPPLRICQRMRLETPQVEGVARKMQMEHEHCMLLALPCGHDHMDVLAQSNNLINGFITYLQQKQAAGIVNFPAPGTTQPCFSFRRRPLNEKQRPRKNNPEEPQDSSDAGRESLRTIPAYVVHVFPSCDFVNENLRRIAPNLLERVADIAHLLIVITTA